VPWTVTVKESAIEDLRWFGKAEGRLILKEAEKILGANPLVESRNLKTLRPNKFAEKELRLLGKFRVLFNVGHKKKTVDIVAVGEKRGESLVVQGEEFTEHHESHRTE
jgi:mRNA-degrading endonuclease RelE of RelBE toxin-antitoxin system